MACTLPPPFCTQLALHLRTPSTHARTRIHMLIHAHPQNAHTVASRHMHTCCVDSVGACLEKLPPQVEVWWADTPARKQTICSVRCHALKPHTGRCKCCFMFRHTHRALHELLHAQKPRGHTKGAAYVSTRSRNTHASAVAAACRGGGHAQSRLRNAPLTAQSTPICAALPQLRPRPLTCVGGRPRALLLAQPQQGRHLAQLDFVLGDCRLCLLRLLLLLLRMQRGVAGHCRAQPLQVRAIVGHSHCRAEPL